MFLVAFALYGYAKGRKAVAMAVEVTKVLCPSDPTSATSADSGMDAGDPRGGRADSTKAVPLLHPGQVRTVCLPSGLPCREAFVGGIFGQER